MLAAMDAAEEAGLYRSKVNVVLLRGQNDDEILDFAGFARETGRIVRFIEFMPLDAQGRWDRDQLVPGQEVFDRISAVWPLEPADDHTGTAPAERFRFVDGGGEIGLISSVTQPFCGTCNRLRLTADGAVRNCLFSDDEHEPADLLRNGGTDTELGFQLRAAVWGKHAGTRHQRARIPPPGSVDVDDRRLAMASLRLFGPAREAAGVARADVSGETVGEVLAAAESRYGGQFAEVVTISRVWVNGESATAEAAGGRRGRGGRHPAGVRRMTMPGRVDDQGSGGRFTHVDEHGKAHMVDVTDKAPTLRIAEARCSVRTTADVAKVLADRYRSRSSRGGPVRRHPGRQARRRPSSLSAIRSASTVWPSTSSKRRMDFASSPRRGIVDRTGVEMEALTACAAAALVLLQPLLEVDPLTSIEELTLLAQDRWPLGNMAAP